MQSGTILLASSYSPTSLIIHMATRSRWNHCGLLVHLDSRSHLTRPSESTRPFVVESTVKHGVTLTPLSVFLTRYTRVDAVSPRDPLPLKPLASAIRSRLGAKFAAFPFVLHTRGELNCAHLVSSVYSELGLLSLSSTPGSFSPDLLQFPADTTTIQRLPNDYLGAISLPLLFMALVFVMAYSLICDYSSSVSGTWRRGTSKSRTAASSE